MNAPTYHQLHLAAPPVQYVTTTHELTFEQLELVEHELLVKHGVPYLFQHEETTAPRAVSTRFDKNWEYDPEDPPRRA